MSEAKFTKGEWHICAMGNVWADDTKITNMREHPNQDGAYRVKSDREHEANAHLIAAAPELYDWIESQLDELPSTARKGAEALLAKARGES